MTSLLNALEAPYNQNLMKKELRMVEITLTNFKALPPILMILIESKTVSIFNIYQNYFRHNLQLNYSQKL